MNSKKPESTVGIVSIVSHFPKKIMTSAEVAFRSGLSEEFIASKLGFKQKRIADISESPSELAIHAARGVLEKANLQPWELDFIIYSSNGIYDYQFWSPSAYIQEMINAKKAITFEVNNGCNAAIAGMYLAKNLLVNTSFKLGLVIVSDTLSKFVNYKDKNLFPLFSLADGATAVVIGTDHSCNIIKSQVLYTDGEFSECSKLLLGGTKNNEITDFNKKGFFSIDLLGEKTQKLRNSAMVTNYIKVITEALTLAHVEINDISLILINQNSIAIIDAIIEKLNIPKDKVYSTRELYGHIGGVDTLFALEDCLNKKLLEKNDLVLLASTGIGYHWGAQIIKI